MTIPVGYAQVTHHFEGAAVPRGAVTGYGVLHVVNASPGGIAAQMHALWGLHIMPNISPEVSLVRTEVKLGPDATGATGEFSDTVAGGQAGSAVPPTVAILVHKLTQSGGRKHRGRMFIPGAPEGQIGGNGVLVDGYRTNLQTDFDAFLTEVANTQTTTSDMVILHDPDKNNVTSAPTEVTKLSVSTLVATQRGRLR